MKNLKNLLGIFAFAMLTIVFISCDDEENNVTPDPQPQSIVDIATGDDQFSTLTAALARVNLVSVLEGDGPFTVFAPTNTAFTALGIDLNTISDEDLTEILLYHVIGAKVMSGDIPEGQTYVSTSAATAPGDNQLSMFIEKTGAAVRINSSVNVTTTNIEATNGVIHIVDAVILPLDIVGHAAANSNFSSLVGALGAASGDLISVLSGAGPFTVFAPVNTAFDEISSILATLSTEQVATVLTYHVVGAANVRSTDLNDNMEVTTVNTETFTVNLGNEVTISDQQGNTATVILTDVQATNGVIHVLNKVILPEQI